MYDIELMEEWERDELEHYSLKEVSYEDKKGEIDRFVEIQIGAVNLNRLKKGGHRSAPYYYPFFKDNLKAASKGVADLLRAKHWLRRHLKNEGAKETDLLYLIYAYYVLEK